MERPNVPETLRCSVSLRTRWSDADMHGELNNAVFLTLLEEARLRYFGDLGLLRGEGFPFVLGQCNLQFVSRGKGGASVQVEMSTTRLGRSSIMQSYRVRDAQTQDIWCTAEALLVCVNEQTQESCPMSSDVRTAIEEFEGSANLPS